MPTDHRARLASIRRFDQLVAYLRDELDWPLGPHDFEELTFDYTPGELGIDAKNEAKIEYIKRLRPLATGQPWGIFFVKFEPKQLPVVALRRILGRVTLKTRASANSSERQAWEVDDLLFVSNYGDGEQRNITFAHFSRPQNGRDLPTLKVLGWDNRDTPLHLDAVARELTENLAWPADDTDLDSWRERWRSAFGLRHREVITTSKQLSERLAELARAIRDRTVVALAIETEAGPLTKLLKAFQTTLVHDLDEAKFADMYAQTITYGLLSARITDPERRTTDDLAAHMRTNPFLRELMEAFLGVGGVGGAGGVDIDFDELGVSEVVELLDQANMEAVVRDFGDKNPQEDPVIHFYEHFLGAYDKQQKVSRGVFYTPRPVVSYIVRSVDELLRKKFGLEDGLADTTTWGQMATRHENLVIPDGISPDKAFVQILDPATGTGTFLVEVIDLMHRSMAKKWKSQGHAANTIRTLWNEYVAKHLLPRLHGYELLMAPYAIAHLKIGLKLFETGYRFESDERARVYLTNALEPARDQQFTLDFLPALAHEAAAVNEIKRNQRFTVVIGNPPYSSISQNKGKWIRKLVNSFRTIHGVPIEEKGKRNHLQDDYVKFIRLALFQMNRCCSGVTGLITNHSYLYGPTFRAMRYHLLRNITGGRILDLNGNAKRNDADRFRGDQNVFDIQQGVAIGIFWQLEANSKSAPLRYGSLVGSRTAKTRALSRMDQAITFHSIAPTPKYYFFESGDIERPIEYDEWSKLDEVMPFGGTGVKTNRDKFVIDFDDEPILQRMGLFRNPQIPDSQVQEELKLRENYTWKIGRQRQLFRSDTNHDRLRDIDYRPFDRRRIYYQRHVVYNPRFKTMSQIHSDNLFLLLCRQQFHTGFRHVFATRQMFECCVVSAKSREITSGFPLYVFDQDGFDGNPAHGTIRRANISRTFLETLDTRLGILLDEGDSSNKTSSHVSARQIMDYIYAILHSDEYRRKYAENLRVDFPRIPVPSVRDLFHELSKKGGELIALHLLESPHLDELITTYYTGSGSLDVSRVGWSDDTVWLNAGKTIAREGHRATKPGTAGFRGVPEEVWDFRIGGYQVCHKWLKDRMGRRLSDEDVGHYQKIVVALKGTVGMMAEIDAVIENHGGWPQAFQTGSEVGTTDADPR